MRISVKLIAGILVIAALVALVGYLTNLTDHTIQTQVKHLSRASLIEVVAAADMTLAIQESHDALHDLIVQQRHVNDATQAAASAAAKDEMERLRKNVRGTMVTFQRCLDQSRQASQSFQSAGDGSPDTAAASGKLPADVANRFQRLDEAFVAHRALVIQCLHLVDSDPAAAEKLLDEQLDAHFNGILFPILREQKRAAEAEFTHEVHGVERAISAANVRNTTATLLALLCALTLGLFLARSIGKPLAELKAAALRIGKGHLDTRIKNRSRDEIGMLAATFNRMAEDLQATTVSKAHVDNILESMSEMLIVADPQLLIRMVNRATLEQLGFAADDLIGKPLALLFDIDPERTPAPVALPAFLDAHEYFLVAKSGHRIPVHWAGSELRGAGGELQGVVCAALNIAQRKQAEERLRASLDEKEVLLKEVHHRVKNNLQIISSLLALQARNNGDPEVRRMFEESQGRIRSMALIHEQLYQSGELSRIDFSEYVRRLCSYLMESSGDHGGPVALRLEVAAEPLPLNLAIPCGMILNELVSNAIKHAFPAGRGGTIRIGFESRDGRYHLSVRDDGVGLVAGAATKSGSLGLKVVDALVKQLGGELTITGEEGAQFEIAFAAPGEIAPPVSQTNGEADTGAVTTSQIPATCESI